MATQEAFDSDIGPITISILGMTLIIILCLVFYLTRYRKFTINQYVIHFRNGKVKKAGMGGRIFLLPFFDEIITLPSIIQRNEFILTKEGFRSSTVRARLPLDLVILWRITDPLLAYSKLEFQENAPNYAGTVLQDLAKNAVVDEMLRLAHDLDDWLMTLTHNSKNRLSKTLEEWGAVLVEFSIQSSNKST